MRRGITADACYENGMEAQLEWVVLRRFDDGLEAQMALDFLRDHGVRVALQGNSGSTSVLNRFDTVLDVRLVVPRGELARGVEVLGAMLVPEPVAALEGGPYRSSLGPPDDDVVRARSRRAAVVLAFAVPIGGGHFYARHHTSGALLALGTAGTFLAGLVASAPWLTLASLLLVTADAFGAVVAVRRYNEGRTAAPEAQALFALAAFGASILAARLLSA